MGSFPPAVKLTFKISARLDLPGNKIAGAKDKSKDIKAKQCITFNRYEILQAIYIHILNQ